MLECSARRLDQKGSKEASHAGHMLNFISPAVNFDLYLYLYSFHSPLYLFSAMADQIKYWHVTYNDIHNLIRESTPKIAKEFNPDLLIAIGSF